MTITSFPYEVVSTNKNMIKSICNEIDKERYYAFKVSVIETLILDSDGIEDITVVIGTSSVTGKVTGTATGTGKIK